jgi:hypothetical protein
MPAGKLVKIGVWENQKFICCVLFGRGANNNLGSPYSLENTEVCELVRVAVGQHQNYISRILALSIKLLRDNNPKLRMIISFADTEQNHLGIIYQATNWVYAGIAEKAGGKQYFIKGKWIHKRTLGSVYGRRDEGYLDNLFPGAPKRDDTDKHRYLYPLDKRMRRQILPLAQPYPKRADVV